MTMTTSKPRLNIKFWHDDCAENPNEWDGWKVYSFCTNHINNKEPYEIGFDLDDEGNHIPDADLQAKLDSGLAHFLSYYEHGQCAWSLRGEGPSCPWDSVGTAGLLVWEQDADDIGAKSYKDREKDARNYVDRYTEWCNGHVFGYTVEAFRVCECCEQDVELDEAEANMDLPSCGGYFDSDLAFALIDLKDQIEHDGCAITFEDGRGAYLADEAKRLWEEMSNE